MNRLIAFLLGGVLVLSLGLNIFLWRQLARQSDPLRAAQVSASEVEESRQQQHPDLARNATNDADSGSADAHELARLRNEVGQLRKQARENAALRAQVTETMQLRAQLAGATQHLARAESALADAMKLSIGEVQQMKEEAQSVQCVSHLKQICLAARVWANDHNELFPSDFVSMQRELNPSWISYRFLNSNGNAQAVTNVLVTCPIHGHFGLSDGSVHRR